MKAFHPVNPTETLIMMQEIVESEEAVCIPIEELNTDVDKSFRAIKSDILIILGGFADIYFMELLSFLQKEKSLI